MEFKLKNINTINDVLTSHGAGVKKVLCANHEADSNITQIAVTRLKKGDLVDVHVHETMEEHFIIEEGSLEFMIADRTMTVSSGSYVLVPAGTKHGIKAITECKMITVGCAVE